MLLNLTFFYIMARYNNNLERDRMGTHPMYRSMTERREQANNEEKKTKSNWFRVGGHTATYTVVASKGSTLQKTSHLGPVQISSSYLYKNKGY